MIRNTAFLLALLMVLITNTAAFGVTARIGAIKVAPSGARIEIQGDQPLTYVYRKMTKGAGIILDIAPGIPDRLGSEIPGAGPVTGLWVKELLVEGIPVTRMVIGLDRDQKVTVGLDPFDSGRVIITFPEVREVATTKPSGTAGGGSRAAEPLSKEIEEATKSVGAPQEPTPVIPVASQTVSTPTVAALNTPLPEVKPSAIEEVTPKPLTLPNAAGSGKPVIESVLVHRNGIELQSKTAITDYDAFKLQKPERLVVDLPMAESTLKSHDIKIGNFGVKQVRIGIYQEKVRVVFDAAGKEGLPLHIIQRTPHGLKITFAGK